MIIVGFAAIGLQFIGEVDAPPEAAGFTTVSYPMFYQEQVHGDRIGIQLRPFSPIYPTEFCYVRIALWRPLKGKDVIQLLSTYEEAVQKEKARISGIVIASAIPVKQ